MSQRYFIAAVVGLLSVAGGCAAALPGARAGGGTDGLRGDAPVADVAQAEPLQGPTERAADLLERVVEVHQDTDPHAVAAELGLTIHTVDAQHHLALVSGQAHQLDALTAHHGVRRQASNGMVRAADIGTPVGPVDGTPTAWHHPGANVPEAMDGLSDIIVAVLDSGVAYRAWCGDRACAPGDVQSHRRVSALDGVSIVAPIDFVDGDRLPLDEHQHGTHLATTILGRGAVPGVAAGAALMPVRILDASGAGTELALVRGIRHAVENGADVIHIGATLTPGVEPSSFLREAIEAAHSAGVVVVAPAGNHGDAHVAWPAAAPSVLAVAASVPEPDHHRLVDPWRTTGIARLAPYSSASAVVDVVAPGGDLRNDRTGDGLPDGILAESIAPGDPSRVGLWLMAGTGHAAAITAGAAARALALGAEPEAVTWAVQRSARPLRGEAPVDGVGGGYLDVARSDDAVHSASQFLDLRPDLEVALEAALETAADGRVRPSAEVVVNAADGGQAPMQVLATIRRGDTTRTVRCRVPIGSDTCTLRGSWSAPDHTEAGDWRVQVDGVLLAQGIIARPAAAVVDASASHTGVSEVEQPLPETTAGAAAETATPALFVGDTNGAERAG